MLAQIKKYLGLIPCLLFFMFFYIFGLIDGILQSLGLKKIIGEPKFTLEYYRNVLSDVTILDSFKLTFKIAVIATILTLLVALVIIYILYINLDNEKFANFLEKTIRIPVVIPYLIATYFILIVFMQNGIISMIGLKLGIISDYKEFPILTNDSYSIGIILTYVWKAAPFVVFISFPILLRISKKWKELAYIMGVSKFQFFRNVVVPILTPTLVISSAIVFFYQFTAFETPFILGVTSPKVLSVTSYTMYSQGEITERGFVMAFNILISLVNIIVALSAYMFFKNKIRKQKAWD